ncbi:hypothetical protein DAPPUDRAFT_238989 [Daphnia pulex]|uniref:Uncharacterized protein n=1 Tax=Daphnia pulex TaxID=6669 RepID=E9G7Y2_DAPPU|nr:hypothetical protein DAPPUDRAFT_238989 [Daphnia pulex]|eukprot:EFX84580.1 hypothetical protein DAPPUDRAFT_238989 [Daphnia pulex]
MKRGINPNALNKPLPRPKSGFQVIKDGVKMFEIHVAEECGINGSLLDLMLDCTSHVRNAGNGCPILGSHIKDVFSYHYTNNDAIGLVVNAPGELTGKITNHANFLHQLKRCGIPPSKMRLPIY